MKNKRQDFPVVGISPLGGNSVEGTSAGMAPVVDSTPQAVPLFYDNRVGAYISEQAVQELDDRDYDEDREEARRKEVEFRQRIGYRQS
jgi:hypothetical protein